MTATAHHSQVFADPEALTAAVMADREYTAVTVSPDNRLLGWISAGPNGPALFVDEISPEGIPAQQPRTVYSAGGLRGYVFLHDGQNILLIVDHIGDENTRALLVDRRSGETTDPLTPAHAQTRFLVHRAEFPHTVFLAINDREPALHDVYALDTGSRELSCLARNPGYDSWIIDYKGRVRGGTKMADDASTRIELNACPADAEQPGHPAIIWTFPPHAAGVSGIRGLTASHGADRAWVLDGNLGDPAPLVEYALEPEGARTVSIHRFPAEVDGTWTAPGTGMPAAVEHGRWFQDITPLDPVTGAKLEKLRRHLEPQTAIHVDRRDRDHDALWSLTVDTLTGPPRCALWHSTNDQLHWLPPQLPGLAHFPQLHTRAFEARAKDGRLLPGYLTNTESTHAHKPAVVLVHGGPWERDEAAFDAETALLAYAGYAVIRVNYRGSAGFGADHLTAGFKQWGAAMSDDLDDAVEHLAQLELIDPARVAVMGASYGGYAALMAGCRTGFRYRCAIAAMAPTDLITLIEGIPDYWQPLRSILTERVGNPETEAQLLRSASPVNHVDRFTTPLLLAHGAQDPRVPNSHIDLLTKTLRRNGVPFEALIFENEGHGLVHVANRQKYYTRVLRFLDTHLYHDEHDHRNETEETT